MSRSDRARRGVTAAANLALAAACAPDHARLLGIRDLRLTQSRLLDRIVRRNANCWFGLEQGLPRVRSVDDFRTAVPLSTWDDYADAVARIAEGEQGVLTTEPVRLLEPSSGSGAATKLIPYPGGLRAEFQRAIRPWLHDLYRSFPALLRGRAYWSVTPAASRADHAGGLRIGFDDDADYLGRIAKRLVGAVFAAPADVARAATMDEFRARTAEALLASDDLALISVWNPTFLTLLLDWITDHLGDLRTPLRSSRIAAAVRAGDWTAVWPRLAVVSCWADAQAAAAASELAERLPGVHLQPKGLLATECFVSLPIEAAGGAVLAARSHFFEFLPQGAGEPVLAHELDAGERYAVVVTTSGGLYRYRLGDLVEVTGHHGPLPVLRFVGRVDRVSDLVGEKLSEAFVASALAAAGASGFTLLTPEGRGYVLYADAAAPGLAERLETELRANFHYDYARRLGQLDAVRLVNVPAGAAGRYAAECVRRGQRLGDVKVPALEVRGGWGPALA